MKRSNNSEQNVYEQYNKIDKKERKKYEVEVRYKTESLAKKSILDLIKSIRGKLKLTEDNFIDFIEYKDQVKIGTRVSIINNKSDVSVPYRKETIAKTHDKNLIGQYTVNLSKEENVNEADIPKNPSVILLKRRFQYVLENHKNWRVDMTIIRQSESASSSIKLAFKEFFTDISSFEDLLEVISKRPHIYKYSVEIEYIDNKNISEAEIKKISIMPFILDNPNIESNIMFEQETLKISNVINSISSSIRWASPITNLKLRYILPQVRVLTKQQYLDMYPPLTYLLKEKTDGIRSVISVNNNKAFVIRDPDLIDVYDLPKYNKELIVDAEYIESKKTFVIFDIVKYHEEKIQIGIEHRIPFIKSCCEVLRKNIPNFTFVEANYLSLSNPQRYKGQIEDKLSSTEYEVDGLIFVNTKQNYKNTITFKWKPVKYQTIDVLCKKCPSNLIKSKGNYLEKKDHDLYFLYTTGSYNLRQNLQIVPNVGYDQLFNINRGDRNLPIQFTTPFVPLSYQYYHPHSSDVDINDKIVEMGCKENDCIEFNNGRYYVNWYIHKIRDDKEVVPGTYYGNSYLTAFYTFLNHINVFDVSFLYNGIPKDQYFLNSGGEDNIYSGTRAFNSYIKSQSINQYAHKAQSVLDIGAGRGGDLYKYIQHNLVKNLVVVDIDKAGLTELFSRWLEMAKKSNTILQTSMRGLVLDINDEYTENISKIKSVVETTYFSSIFMHSCIHYFTESIETIRNLAYFCKKLTTTGSNIVVTCPYGEAIFDKLKNKSTYSIIENDSIKYKINKIYTDEVMTPGGQKISIMLPFTKGKMYEEYLVNTTAITEIFKENGFSLKVKLTYNEYLVGFNIHKKHKYNSLSDGDKEWASLYIALVYERQ
uniref:mRNA (guanine-N(7))-methyltransferase n=1 Tax=viral metagenome TaxID=1070528 RepID=A0A6C0LIZ7_9ZZZZ